MKKIILICVVFCTVVLSSCYKNEPDPINFNVEVENLVVDAGDSVTFHLDGYADLITFYSGEAGNAYVNRHRTEAEGLGLQLTIASRVLYGAQEGNLRLMVSTDFSGIYAPEHIHDDEWTDITDRFTWSTAVPSGIAPTTTTSEPVDLTEFTTSGRPVYFGYRYESQAATSAATAGRVWRLPIFNLEAVSEDGAASEIANVLSAGWQAVPIISAVDRPQNTSYWTIRTADPYLWFTPNSTIEPHLHWMITAPFSPTKVNPDSPLTIKSLIDKMENTFKHAFTTPGKYTVTFVGANVNAYGKNEMVKEFSIEVK